MRVSAGRRPYVLIVKPGLTLRLRLRLMLRLRLRPRLRLRLRLRHTLHEGVRP